MQTAVRLNTVGLIADKLGVPICRVSYILQTRPHIRPVALAGRARLYDQAAVAKIRYEINLIDARRAAREADHA